MGRLYCLEVMYYEWKGGRRRRRRGKGVLPKRKKEKNLSNHHQTKQTRQLTHLTSHSLTFN